MSRIEAGRDGRSDGSPLALLFLPVAHCLCLLAIAAPAAGATFGPYSAFHQRLRTGPQLFAPASSGLERSESQRSDAGGEVEPYSANPSGTRPYAVCPPPTVVRVSCLAAVVPIERGEPVIGPGLEGSGNLGGFSPEDLRSAYGLPGNGGKGQTVAITVAYDNPNAEADLATYRNYYGLPPCIGASGCFEKVNQRGEVGNYPVANANWAMEGSLDLDMVSAVCPGCHILLVEADSNLLEDMGAAVQKAAELGATVISNSWSTQEFPEEVDAEHYFRHLGIPALFASGDSGYGVEYPAASPGVVAVGGTSLQRSANSRGWSENAWSGGGSGCSQYEPKPSWQKDEGCAKRTVADVSAVSDPLTPVSTYGTYEGPGWRLVGGTSVATPIIAGIEALSSGAFRAAGPSAFYRAGNGGRLTDVIEGENGSCSREGKGGFAAVYLCQADAGYDGPTGWGTPMEPLSLPVSVTEAATVLSTEKAVLRGSVEPSGLPTKYRFEYGTTTSYGSNVPVPEADVEGNAEYNDVSQTLEGLEGRTPYHYRIVATNSAGTFPGVDRTVGTTKPVAITGRASDIHVSDATLRAVVNPEGLDTTYYFEYGPTASYEFKLPVRAKELAGDTEDIEVSAIIDSLAGGSPYHYRVVAKNVGGTVQGRDRVFVTEPSKWAIDHPPKESGGDQPFAISCVEADDCVMVGAQFDGERITFVTLAKVWDGSVWHPMQTANPPELDESLFSGGARLVSVSCIPGGECFAVGRYRNSEGVTKPLVEQREGSNWTIMPLPELSGMASGGLEGVSCASATACSAVGYFATESGVDQALVARWDGIQWELQPGAEPAGATSTRMTGVSCASPALCVATGVYQDGSERERTLVEQWAGGVWTIQPTPEPEDGLRAGLSGVSCVAVDSCSAVGHITSQSGARRPLAERWDGSNWTVVSTPSLPAGKAGELYSVSCASALACTASGLTSNEPSRPDEVISAKIRWLVERWTGGAWTVLDVGGVPVPAGWWHDDFLNALSCPEVEACRGVGYGTAASEGETSPITAIALRERMPPFAQFSATPDSPRIEDQVDFDAASTIPDPNHPIERYAWDFGDGSTGTGEAPSHAYSHGGDYIVALTVTDERGKVGTISHVVTVIGRAPVASFDVAASPSPAQPVAFDGSASADPDGTIVRYAWGFGDGAVGNGSMPIHIYAAPGLYTVTLRVTDDEGLTGEASHLVPVAQPRAGAVTPPQGFGVTEAPRDSPFTVKYITTRCDGEIVLSLYAADAGAFRAHAVGRALPLHRSRRPRRGSRNHQAPCLTGRLARPAESGRLRMAARPAGDIRLSHPRYIDYGSGAAVSSPSKAVKLMIQPRPGIFAALKKGRELYVRIAVAFTSQGGTPTVEHQTVVVRFR